MTTPAQPTKKPSLVRGAIIGYFIATIIGMVVGWIIAVRSGGFGNRNALMLLVSFAALGTYEGYRYAVRARKKLGVNEPGDEWQQFFGSFRFNCLAAMVIAGSLVMSLAESLVFDLVYGAPWLQNR